MTCPYAAANEFRHDILEALLQLPQVGSTDAQDGEPVYKVRLGAVFAHVHMFIAEYDPDEQQAFGFISTAPGCLELGYIDMGPWIDIAPRIALMRDTTHDPMTRKQINTLRDRQGL